MQKDMLPIIGLSSSKGSFMEVIAEETGCKPEDILGHDLFLYVRGRGTVWGAHGEFISGGHLDDLQCGFADLRGYLASAEADSIPILGQLDDIAVIALALKFVEPELKEFLKEQGGSVQKIQLFSTDPALRLKLLQDLPHRCLVTPFRR